MISLCACDNKNDVSSNYHNSSTTQSDNENNFSSSETGFTDKATDEAAADKAAADKAAADKAAADKAAADKAAADKAAADKAAADKAAADKAAADKAAADKAAADKAAADKRQQEIALRQQSRAKVNEETLENDLKTKFPTVNIGIDTWNLNYNVVKNDSEYHSDDITIHVDWGWPEVDPWDLADSIDFTEQQRRQAMIYLKNFQKEICNYVTNQFPALKVRGGFYHGYYKYPSINAGYNSISFLTWANHDINQVYNNSFLTPFAWYPDYDSKHYYHICDYNN